MNDEERAIEERTYRKVSARLVPILFVCYVVAYLDRVNVGFARLQMVSDLKFSETVYGVGAGIFFLGYFIFEVPSNMILHRVGARRWMARIMITWGILSSLTMFVRSAELFYVMRFLLGLAEAGFFPGIILYLTYWFPAERRGRMTALFMTAVPVTGVVGGPLSGWIMESLAGTFGWRGWQWLFLIEGLPSIVVGFLLFTFLDDGIRDAKWLTEEEKKVVEAAVQRDAKGKEDAPLGAVFKNPRVWLLSAIYFCLVMGVYGVSFWLPTLIKATGVMDPLHVGLLTSIPYSVATVAMVLIGRSSDLRNERRWHLAVPALLGAIGLVLSAMYQTNTVLAMAALSLATMGIISTLPAFWALPTAFLGGAAAAAGLALINSVGNLAGFLSPTLVGRIKDATHSTSIGMYVLAACLGLAAVLVVGAVPERWLKP
jgi:D-galactonate transporter